MGAFERDNGSAAALVDGDELRRLGGQPAPHEPAVEGLGILAYPPDVMHGSFRSVVLWTLPATGRLVSIVPVSTTWF